MRGRGRAGGKGWENKNRSSQLYQWNIQKAYKQSRPSQWISSSEYLYFHNRANSTDRVWLMWNIYVSCPLLLLVWHLWSGLNVTASSRHVDWSCYDWFRLGMSHDRVVTAPASVHSFVIYLLLSTWKILHLSSRLPAVSSAYCSSDKSCLCTRVCARLCVCVWECLFPTAWSLVAAFLQSDLMCAA